MSAVDDAKKYLSLRPPMENKTIFALHPDVLVGGLLDEIERLREAHDDMIRRERSQALQDIANEGQLCDLLDAKDKVIDRLQNALDQVLDDMGAEGYSVCGATKAQVRYALGYKVDPDFDPYPLDRAISVLVEVGEFGTKEEAYAALREGK